MSEEIDKIDEDYQEEAASLLERIERREEMRELLKVAAPSKIPAIRAYIAKLDKIIEETEEIMEVLVKKRRLQAELEQEYEELDKMNKAIEPELLAYLEKNNPEAYEKLKAELEEIDARSDEDE